MHRAHSFHTEYRPKKHVQNSEPPTSWNGMRWFVGQPEMGWMVTRESEEHMAKCVCAYIKKKNIHTPIVSFLLRYHKVKRGLFYASKGQVVSGNKVFHLLHPGVEVWTRRFFPSRTQQLLQDFQPHHPLLQMNNPEGSLIPLIVCAVLY